jgi:hypothetical protein
MCHPVGRHAPFLVRAGDFLKEEGVPSHLHPFARVESLPYFLVGAGIQAGIETHVAAKGKTRRERGGGWEEGRSERRMAQGRSHTTTESTTREPMNVHHHDFPSGLP